MEPLKNFLWRYIAGPVVADARNAEQAVWNEVVAQTGYNIYNTIAWGILAAILVFGLYRAFQKYEVEFDTSTVLHSIPFVILGGTLRFIEDTGVMPFEASLLLITPVIYFLIGAVYITVFLTSIKISRRYDIGRDKVLLYLGAGLLLVPLLYSLYLVSIFDPKPVLVILTLAIGAFATLIYYLSVQETVYDRIEYHIAVFSQLFGGAASMIAVTQGYEQKQLLAQLSTKIFGFPGILIFKAGLAAFALYILKDIEDEMMRALTIFVLIVIGIATGLRVLLKMTAGI